jgi:hypothetical protein
MDYQKHHDLLIAKRGKKEKPNDEGYYERHHILPRSLGGSDEDDNLIYLTGREHFMVHWLLYKIHGAGPMADAFYAMTMDRYGNRYAPNARLIEIAMKAKRDAHSNRWLNGELDLSNYSKRMGNIDATRSHFQTKEYKESVSGLKSPMSKFIFDFYDEDGGVVHTGTYATFAKAFDEERSRVYNHFKNKGFYLGWTIGNKRENPHRTRAILYDVIDYKTNKVLRKGLGQKEISEIYNLHKLSVNHVIKGKQRQTKGYTFKPSGPHDAKLKELKNTLDIAYAAYVAALKNKD